MSPRILYYIFEVLKKRQKQKNNTHGCCFSTFTALACKGTKKKALHQPFFFSVSF